jgi:AraC family ethanolamine operon transcriptional activator
MEETLASLALSCFQPDGVKSPRGPRSKRMRALAGALELLKPADPGRLGVEELAYRTGVSRRTLEYAFRDGLGVSPSAYLKAWRLQALNRDLLRADPAEVSVAELVCPRGFVHQGQLAADYRNLFGELPSETLRRHRA